MNFLGTNISPTLNRKLRVSEALRAFVAVATLLACSGQAIAGSKEVYRAKLTSLNDGKIGTHSEGAATFTVEGDKLIVHIKMRGVPASIEHWEHFHGFPNGAPAACATARQDKNGDGFVDLGETELVSGTTMVPFNDAPEKMNIPTHTYPHASASGAYEYTKIVPLSALSETFGKTYDGKSIDLDKRVVYVHGVPENSSLPSSVGSLGPVPANITLPIACGKIVRVK